MNTTETTTTAPAHTQEHRETVTIEVPAAITALCAEFGTTAQEFVRSLVQDALDNPAIARDLLLDERDGWIDSRPAPASTGHRSQRTVT